MMTEAERLAAYDRMYADLLKERDKVLADMDKLRAAGRNRGTTYQQLLAQKLTVQNLIGRFEGQAGANAPACFACGEGSPDGRPDRGRPHGQKGPGVWQDSIPYSGRPSAVRQKNSRGETFRPAPAYIG